MFLSANLFATMNVFVRLASTEAHWALVAAVRAYTGALVALSVAQYRGHSLRPNRPRAMWWRSTTGTVTTICTFYALARRDMPLSDTVTLLCLSPLSTALFAPSLLKEPSERTTWIAALIGALGVTFIVRPTFLFGADTHASPLTAAVAMFAAFTSGLAMIALRAVGQRENAEAISFHFSLTAGTTLLALSFLDPKMPTPRAALYMVVAGLLGGVAQLAMTSAYAHQNAARIAPISYVAVITSALLGAAVLHEVPTLPQIGGMALIILAGLVLARPYMLKTKSK